jgi:hypothetical protein
MAQTDKSHSIAGVVHWDHTVSFHLRGFSVTRFDYNGA